MARKEKQLPADFEGLMALAGKTDDPVLKEKCLLAAEKLRPDSLAVKRSLLMLGNLARRDGKKADPSVIKCYMLHVFEHPEQHTEAECARLTGEVFCHPQLEACLALCGDKQKFMQEYLEEICRDYLHIFIEGQREHAGGYLGFQWIGRRVKALSRPCADMVMNMMLSPFLTEEECMLLTGIFYRSCLAFLGRSNDLDELLPAQIRERIR